MVPVIDGWIEQWYGNVPFVANVKLKLPLGAILPESHTSVSETMSCVVASVFDQVMTPPCETFTGFGTNAAAPNVRALV